ncbi:long-chain fatty acid--CoA ligase [Rhodococcus sp. NPDC127530]|uniref:long-chain-fatty-acid--CoA ligase n=1 Tax=unclassified Rhodococcus (in: high G+C Gram-positive bacteria) TaxID=192944 RepID=UPI00363B3F3B
MTLHTASPFNLASLLERSSARHPGRTAVVLGDQRTSFADLDQAANRVANLLVGKGVEPGDKVALMCPNVPWFSVVYWGILKAGATVVPLNVLLKAPEVAYHLTDSDAVALFVFEGTADLPMAQEAQDGFAAAAGCRDLVVITADADATSPLEGVATLAQAWVDQPGSFDTVETSGDDTAVILYTSGTTGHPKGAELRHRNMRDNALACQELFGLSEDDPDRYLCVLPLFHSFGQTAVQNAAAAFGGTLVMLPRFEANAALELLQKEDITFFAGVPTMYWGLLGALRPGGGRSSVDVERIARNLRVAASGGSPLPVEVHREFEEKFGVVIAEGYGLSETSPLASFTPFGTPARPGSIGPAIPGVDMELIAPRSWEPIEWTPDAIGEIAIRGHNVMKGYYKRGEATAEVIGPDGWFRSGDLARRDADGWYYIVDRAKDMIIRGGFNVYPREIEEVLLTHPAVSLAAVVGAPHPSHGEEIHAFVIPRPGEVADPDEIIAWCKERVAAYKYPRVVEVVDSLPMTATGKLLKRELKGGLPSRSAAVSG